MTIWWTPEIRKPPPSTVVEIGAFDEDGTIITGGSEQKILKRHGYDSTWSKSVAVPNNKVHQTAADFFLWTTVAEGPPPEVWRFIK